MIAESVERVTHKDPAQREWCINEEEITVWVNTSSLALRALLEKDGAVLEDVCWSRPANDAWHINLAELDTMVKGVNLAQQWQVKRMCLRTDFFCVYH